MVRRKKSVSKKHKLLWIGGILVVLLLIAISAGIYFYKFYVFKELRFCISKNADIMPLACSNSDFCITRFMENSDIPGYIESAPEFIKEKVDETIKKAVYCDNTCKVKKVRGYGELGQIKSCTDDEEEILLEIKGKEGLEILKFLKNRKD